MKIMKMVYALFAGLALAVRPFVYGSTGDTLAGALRTYESGADESALREFDALLNVSAGNAGARADLEAGLIRLLAADTTFEAKRFACTRLAVFGSEASVPALAALLDKEETVGIACYALCGVKSDRAGVALREALRTAKGVARVQIVRALERRAEAESVETLTALTLDADAAVACASVRALGAIAAPAAEAAVAALRRDMPAVIDQAVADASLAVAERRLAAGDRRMAGEICGELLGRKLPAHLRRGALALAMRCDRDGGTARALALLEAEPADPVLVPVALARAPEMKGWFVSRRLGARLERLPPELQALLVGALARRGDSPARAAVRRAAASEHAAVRLAAVSAIGQDGGAEAVPALAAALARAGSPDEAKAAELALAGLKGGAGTDEAVCKALRDAPAGVKAALLNVLARRGGQAAAGALLDCACSGDKEVARAASQALTRLADGGDAASLPALRRALAGKDAARSDAALRALAAWRSVDAWEILLGEYLAPAGDAQRALALRGLIRIAGEGNARPDAALAARYRQILDGAKAEGERRMILNTLAGAAHPDALALAVQMLSVPGLRGEAEQAVLRIAGALEKSHPELARDALQKAKGAQ